MVSPRRLKAPPIVEAVIDFRVRLRAPLAGAALASVSAEFKEQFPSCMLMKQHAFALTIAVGDEPNQSSTSETQPGVRFDSAAKDRVAIFTVDGFTFSRVNGYSDWSMLKADAMAAWAEYSRLANPLEIVRVGLRYINRFEFQSPIELNDFFTAAPTLPPELPQVIGPFHSRVVFPLVDGIGEGSLTHVLTPSMGSEIHVILDIDVYQENTNYDANSMNAWDLLDKFREQKNKIFFASVTNKALEKYL